MWMLFLSSFINFCSASNLLWSFLCFFNFLAFWPFPWQRQPFQGFIKFDQGISEKSARQNCAESGIIRIIIITRFDCVWMQTQKFPNNPHIRIPHFKILLDINLHWNRRPLTIWRFWWQPFWKWWPRKNDPECKFHHYQPIPHFKILLDIKFYWNRRPLTICRFCWGPFWKRWHHKDDPECNFIITNQFLTSK